jgi:hypothetical protein
MAEHAREGELQKCAISRQDLKKLAKTVKDGLPSYDMVFYEVYGTTLSNGNEYAAESLDELFPTENTSERLSLWIAGINKLGETNKVEFSSCPTSTSLKVCGHDQQWVDAEFNAIANSIGRLRSSIVD